MSYKTEGSFKIRTNEKVIYRGNRSWRSYSMWILFSISWIFLGLFYPLLFFLGIILLFIIIFKIASSEFLITTEGIYSKRWTILDSKIDYLKWDKVEEISLVKSNMGELLDHGDINIGPLGGDPMVIKGIKKPDRVIKLIEEKR